MKKQLALAALFFSPRLLCGTVLQPWYPEGAVELQARADYLFQFFNRVQSSDQDFTYKARDSFLDLSVLGAIEGYGAELEIVLSDTKKHSFYPDCFRLTGRYQWLNDSVGDPCSVIVGLTATIPTIHGLDDISSFHHGHFETEAHVAVGQEAICGSTWTSRYWGVAGIGCATDEGSPWIRGDVHFETNWDSQLFLDVFLKGLMGFGGKAIHREDFHGYGSIAHRSVDLGSKITYRSEDRWTASLGYVYRVYSYNFPRNVNQITIDLMYPLGLPRQNLSSCY